MIPETKLTIFIEGLWENTIDAVCQHRAASVELIAKYLSILGNNQRAQRGILNILQIQLAFG